MTRGEQTPTELAVHASGIGGIDETQVTLDAGVNVLEGRNATNRTSFLQAIMAGMGSNRVSLKGDRDEGSVELTIDGETYTRRLVREGDDVRFEGDPYLDDVTEADLFAFLLEFNEARRAVTTDAELREVIMEPVDTAEIEHQITSLQAERQEIDDEIDRLEQRKGRLPELAERKRELEDELAEERDHLEDLRAAVERADADVETKQAEQEQLDETLAALNDTRSALEDVEYRLETERQAVDSLETDLEAALEERAELPDAPGDRLTEIESQIERLRDRKRTLETQVSKLQRMVQFNEEMLEGEGALQDLFQDDDGDLTDELLGDAAETTCWTCGSTVERNSITDMLDKLRSLSQEQRQERTDVESELSDLTDERDRLQEVERRRERLAGRIDDLESQIDEREATIADLEARADDLRDEIADLEAQAEELEAAVESEVLDRHRDLTEQEVRVDRLEDELRSVEAQIEEIEGAVSEIDALEAKREQIAEQLTELRTRIERLETEAVEAFNEHMAELVEVLEYENLSRIWLERTAPHGGEGRFELHVVRTADDGTTYEDRVAHLSESEREVVGLVFALGGYLVHEVYEHVPVMLLDSLEAIDADRIALLIEYLADFAPTIVAALLPEDANALDGSYTRVREI